MPMTNFQSVFQQAQVKFNIDDYYERNELGDAELAASKLNGMFVFDHSSSTWYIWDKHHWREDKIREVDNKVSSAASSEYTSEAASLRANLTGGNAAKAENYLKRAALILGKQRTTNILYWLASQEGFALCGDEWDSKPWLLACNNGVIDLKTGQIRQGEPEDYIKSYCPVDYKGVDCRSDLWENTVSQIFANNTEVTEYVQRLFGYCISGVIHEHIVPILSGVGRNGKSLLLDIIGTVLGNDLTITAPADALMDTGQRGDSPQPFLYNLRGKRLGWLSESNEGRRFNAALIKQLTGGDKLNVRTLHSKPVTFNATHKIILLTNHKPHAPADDVAFWDRVQVVEFNQRFIDNPDPSKPNEHKQDATLKTRLLNTEQSGVLSWLVRGCLAWQKEGLNPPACVKSATQDYQQEEDVTGEFFTECCELDNSYSVKAGDLYQGYRTWALGYGISPMSLTAFCKRVQGKFGPPKRTNSARYYYGLRLKP